MLFDQLDVLLFIVCTTQTTIRVTSKKDGPQVFDPTDYGCARGSCRLESSVIDEKMVVRHHRARLMPAKHRPQSCNGPMVHRLSEG
jgi:hypothetical protein